MKGFTGVTNRSRKTNMKAEDCRHIALDACEGKRNFPDALLLFFKLLLLLLPFLCDGGSVVLTQLA